MPQYDYTPIRIEVEIPDLIIGDTIIKRKIELDSMVYNQAAQAVTLDWIIKHYSNEGGKYGVYLGDEERYIKIEDKRRSTVADNLSFVNAQTGEFITEEEKDSIMWIGQYDFFNMIAETIPIKVHKMIEDYGKKINWD